MNSARSASNSGATRPKELPSLIAACVCVSVWVCMYMRTEEGVGVNDSLSLSHTHDHTETDTYLVIAHIKLLSQSVEVVGFSHDGACLMLGVCVHVYVGVRMMRNMGFGEGAGRKEGRNKGREGLCVYLCLLFFCCVCACLYLDECVFRGVRWM